MTAILECVLASEDKRTHDLFSGFAEQIARGGDGNKGVGKAIWDALKGGLELVSKAAGTSQAVGAAVEYWDTFFDVV
ncbi:MULTISPECIES: hypothetical protein [unclassified Thiocapsa]|uniref:hypothetical protein n=1 Tax=unclassified Thiocapsa TaxID=2641286 RepID=UPI0035B08561